MSNVHTEVEACDCTLAETPLWSLHWKLTLGRKIPCCTRGSNPATVLHLDFQSNAVPTELSRPLITSYLTPCQAPNREREIEREREGLQGIFILELTSLPAPDPSKDVKETIPKISFNEYTYHVSHILHLWDMVMYRELKPNSRSWQVKEAAVFEFFLWIQSCRRLLSVHWGRHRENPSVSIFSEG